MTKETHLAVSATLEGAPYETHVAIRHHGLRLDEPVEQGGQDLGPKPHELLCTSLAACTAITVRMYVDRKQLPVRKVTVTCTMDRKADGGAVDTSFHLAVHVDGDLTDEQRQRVLQIANMCPVHRTLTNPLRITSALA
ncbi:MAG: OsmC family protein [Flavobacteriales bacterium]|nr:OsmC family protein [Flavobacteriales bacterium]